MGGVSVFAFQLSGHPWQIDLHMYFFAGAGMSGRLLRLSADRYRHRGGRAPSSGPELHSAGGGFPGGASFGASFFMPSFSGLKRCLDLACPRALAACSRAAAQNAAEAEAAARRRGAHEAERVEAERRCQAGTRRDDARLATDFERKIGHIVEAVAVAASEMQGMSSSMSRSSDETARQTSAAPPASTQARRTSERVARRPNSSRPRSAGSLSR